MNDLFLKFIEKLGSIDNTFLFAVSIIPYVIFLFYLYKIKSINNLEKEEKPYEEIINAEFSTIQENKNNEVNPRSHG